MVSIFFKKIVYHGSSNRVCIVHAGDALRLWNSVMPAVSCDVVGCGCQPCRGVCWAPLPGHTLWVCPLGCRVCWFCGLIVFRSVPVVVWIGTSGQCVLLSWMTRFLLRCSFRLCCRCVCGCSLLLWLLPLWSWLCVGLLVPLCRLRIVLILPMIVLPLLVFCCRIVRRIPSLSRWIRLLIFLCLGILPSPHRRRCSGRWVPLFVVCVLVEWSSCIVVFHVGTARDVSTCGGFVVSAVVGLLPVPLLKS